MDGDRARRLRAGSSGAGGQRAVGDVVTSIDGIPVRKVEDIGAVLEARRAGDTVTVTFVRDGRHQTARVVLGAWPTS